MSNLNKIPIFKIFTIILSIFASPASTFQNPGKVENDNDLQSVDEEMGRTCTSVFRSSKSRSC